MTPERQTPRNLWHDRRAVTAIEYALIAVLVFVVVIGGVSALSNGIYNTLYAKIAGAM